MLNLIFPKMIKDIFGDLDFIIIHIDNLLICCYDLKNRKRHLEIICKRIYGHGSVLSKSKIIFSQKEFNAQISYLINAGLNRRIIYLNIYKYFLAA